MSDPFEHFDAAYVLGALSPGERRLFEEHLAGCGACAARVAEVADLPTQLALLSAADVRPDAVPADPGLPDTVWPALLRAARLRRRRTAGLLAGLAAVAAAAVVALAVVLWPASTASRPSTVAMRAAPGAPVSATVRLVRRTWGTELDVHCRYAAAGGGGAASVPYVLVVARADGTEQSLNRWKLGPGGEGDFVGATDWEADEIHRVAIQLLPTRLTVLTLER